MKEYGKQQPLRSRIVGVHGIINGDFLSNENQLQIYKQVGCKFDCLLSTGIRTYHARKEYKTLKLQKSKKDREEKERRTKEGSNI